MEQLSWSRESDAGYYVPHHGVFREHAATTKLRVVYNASATAPDGKSLNDMVDPGPSLLPSLAGMLLRFREYKSALQADIRKAFFMVAVNPEDRTCVSCGPVEATAMNC